MILPIFNSLDRLNPTLIYAARDLGASAFTTFRRVVLPLTMDGVKSGIQVVFIPALSLFMITRLIAGNRVITLGTAIEQQFLVTQNWGMGSTIAVFLILFMVIIMLITGQKDKGVAYDEQTICFSQSLFNNCFYRSLCSNFLFNLLLV